MEIANQYLAGFFDGEGCITFQKFFSKKYQRKYVTAINIEICQKEPAVLFLYRNRFGGFIWTRKNRTLSQWQLNGARKIEIFLNAVKPYLIIKRIEAELALELLEKISIPNTNRIKDKSGRIPLTMRSITSEELDRRENLLKRFEADRANPKHSPIT